MTTALEPTERFTDTVQAYLKYRPTYPAGVIETLVAECGLTQNASVADIGAGTGILTKLLLERAKLVYGVEPNDAMRAAAEQYLTEYNNFCSVAAAAEATTLADSSVDLITVGTAFHWFDVSKTQQEFKRILRPGGAVLLVWNVRNSVTSALVQDYENLIKQYNTDYCTTNASKFDQKIIAAFFAPQALQMKTFANQQAFDWEGFKGRLLSTSYSLKSDAPNYKAMLAALRAVFDRHQCDGRVTFLYSTKLYYGVLVEK